MSDIVKNYQNILIRIKKSFDAYYELSKDVKLVCVTKGVEAERIIPILEAGGRIFGENRVSEATEKWLPLKEKYPDIELHLIGPLQTNKIKAALKVFDVIQTLDRPSLASALAKNSVLPKLFMQVNTGEEPQKSGVALSGAEDFFKQCENEYGLRIEGLMCIPPVNALPVYHFALLTSLGRKLRADLKMSMGMSADFEAAVACGADYVRVGSAVFNSS